MTISNLDQIQDDDLFACTDEDGVTKSVTGAQFKELFPPQLPEFSCWEGHWDRVIYGYRLFLKGADPLLDAEMARYGVVDSTPKPVPCAVHDGYGGWEIGDQDFWLFVESPNEYWRVKTNIDDYQASKPEADRDPWMIGNGCAPPDVSNPFTHTGMELVATQDDIVNDKQFSVLIGTRIDIYYPKVYWEDLQWYEQYYRAPIYIDGNKYEVDQITLNPSGNIKMFLMGVGGWPNYPIGSVHTFSNKRP